MGRRLGRSERLVFSVHRAQQPKLDRKGDDVRARDRHEARICTEEVDGHAGSERAERLGEKVDARHCRVHRRELLVVAFGPNGRHPILSYGDVGDERTNRLNDSADNHGRE